MSPNNNLQKLVPLKNSTSNANGFSTVSYSLDNQLLTKQLLANLINLFWEENITNDSFYALFIVIEYKTAYKALGKASKVNRNDLKKFLKVMLAQLDFKDNQYLLTEVIAIHFKFKPISNDLLVDKNSIIHEPVDKYNLTTSQSFGFDLPNTMDILRWGLIIKHDISANILYIEFFKNGSKYVYVIQRGDNFNNVLIKEDIFDDVILLEFTDYSENGSFTNFTRKVKNFEYIFKNSKIVVTIENKSFNFMKSLAEAKNNYSKFITFDLETRTLDNEMLPYCIGLYDGKKTKSFYLSDFKDAGAMITAFLWDLLSNKQYNKSIVYAHNLSKFDGIFILKYLYLTAISLNFKVHIIKRESDIINIVLLSEANDFTITFRDSLLFLPSSLRKLAKSFSVQNKSIFPYAFVNDNKIDLNYVGNVPDFKYFTDVTLSQYKYYSTKFTDNWSLKKETIKYCLQDCVSLYQVLVKFSNFIFDNLKVNLRFAPTTSSLALRTFRSAFLNGSINIPIIHGRRSRNL